MMEESRWNIRLPLEFDIMMQLSPTIHLKTRTRDVSFEGMLVAVSLPETKRNVRVHVHFEHQNRFVRAAAVVVRTGPDGTALMFTEDNGEVADALALLMESEFDRLQTTARDTAKKPFSA